MTTTAVAPILSCLIGGDTVNHKLTAMPKSHPEQQCCSTQQKSCLVLKKKGVNKACIVKISIKKSEDGA